MTSIRQIPLLSVGFGLGFCLALIGSLWFVLQRPGDLRLPSPTVNEGLWLVLLGSVVSLLFGVALRLFGTRQVTCSLRALFIAAFGFGLVAFGFLYLSLFWLFASTDSSPVLALPVIIGVIVVMAGLFSRWADHVICHNDG